LWGGRVAQGGRVGRVWAVWAWEELARHCAQVCQCVRAHRGRGLGLNWGYTSEAERGSVPQRGPAD
jgi:hypothetical protein